MIPAGDVVTLGIPKFFELLICRREQRDARTRFADR